jgi:FkbM family methyltransferase
MLQRAVVENGFQHIVTPLQMGLSDTTRDAEICVSVDSELNTLHGASGAVELIHLETLDCVVPRLTGGADIDFVKLDAEGEELAILNGGPRFLAEQSPVVMFELRHGAQYNEGLWAAFEGRDYGVYRLMPGPNVLVPASQEEQFDSFQLNMFAMKQDRAALMAERNLLAPGVREVQCGPCPRWDVALESAPWIGVVLPGWRTAMGEHPSGLLAQHATALEYILQTRNEKFTAAVRVEMLRRAAEIWREIQHQMPESLSVRICLARAEFELGRRQVALQTISNVWRQLSTVNPQVAFGLPFIPPVARFDCRPVRGTIQTWLLASMVEAVESWRAWSSFFTRDAQEGIEPHLQNPDLTSGMRRRAWLCNRILGNRPVLTSSSAYLAGDESGNRKLWDRMVRSFT